MLVRFVVLIGIVVYELFFHGWHFYCVISDSNLITKQKKSATDFIFAGLLFFAAQPPSKKYQYSNLNDDESLQTHYRLLKILENKKPFLNPELTLAELAKLIPTHHNF